MQEVGLVLGGVGGPQQPAGAVVAVDAGVVAGGDALGPQRQRVLEEGLELDLAVAQHVRVGRAAGAVLGEEMAEHAVPVLAREVADVEGQAEAGADRHRVAAIGVRAARPVALVLLPVLHEEPGDAAARAGQQQGGDRGVHAAGHADHDRWPGRRHPRHARAPTLSPRPRTAGNPAGCAGQPASRRRRAPPAGCARARAAASSSARDSHSTRSMPAVEDRAGELLDRLGAEGEAQEGRAVVPAGPLVDPDQGLRPHDPAGLLQGLARGRVDQGLARLEVPGRLVDHQAAAHALLHEQEAPVAFHDRGDGGVGPPDSVGRRLGSAGCVAGHGSVPAALAGRALAAREPAPRSPA